MKGKGFVCVSSCGGVADYRIDPADMEGFGVCMGCGVYVTTNKVPINYNDETLACCCSQCVRQDKELMRAVHGDEQ